MLKLNLIYQYLNPLDVKSILNESFTVNQRKDTDSCDFSDQTFFVCMELSNKIKLIVMQNEWSYLLIFTVTYRGSTVNYFVIIY